MQVQGPTQSMPQINRNGIPPLSQLQALPLNRFQVLIRWKVSPDVGSSHDISDYDFEILRSHSANDGFEPIVDPVRGATEWLDTPPSIDDRWIRIYYKLKVTDKSDPEKTYTFGPVSTQEGYGPTLEALYIIDQLNGLLHCRPVGHVAFAYIKASWGSRCDCWNYMAQRSNDDNCLNCAGTGWMYPYSSMPIRFLLGINPRTEIVGGGDHEAHQDDRSCWATNYPDLKKGDIVHIPSENNTIYRVEGKQWVAEERGFGVRQAFRLIPVGIDSPLYELIQMDAEEAGNYLDAIWGMTLNSHFGTSGVNPDVPTSRHDVSAPGGGFASDKPWVP